jgi:serine/threonine protein kinase
MGTPNHTMTLRRDCSILVKPLVCLLPVKLDVGQTNYEILLLLRRGGMGKVFKVRNLISDRIEAMKVLLPDTDSDPELAERFNSTASN